MDKSLEELLSELVAYEEKLKREQEQSEGKLEYIYDYEPDFSWEERPKEEKQTIIKIEL